MLKNKIFSIIMLNLWLLVSILASYLYFNINVINISKEETKNIMSDFTAEMKNTDPFQQTHIIKNTRTCITNKVANKVSKDSEILDSILSADNGLSFLFSDTEISTVILNLPKNDIIEECLISYIENSSSLEDLNKRKELLERYGLLKSH